MRRVVGLGVLLGCLASLSLASGQNTLSTAPLSPPGGSSPSMPIAGGAGDLINFIDWPMAADSYGICSSVDVIYFSEDSADTFWAFDVDLNPLGEFDKPAGAMPSRGLAFRPGTPDTLFFLNETDSLLVRSEVDGTFIASFPFVTATAGGAPRSMTYNDFTDSLFVVDAANDEIFELNLDGTPGAIPPIPNPSIPPGGGGVFGTGAAHIDGTNLFDVSHGPGIAGQTTTLSRQDIDGNIHDGVGGNLLPIDAFVSAFAYHGTGSTGVPVLYGVGRDSAILFEITTFDVCPHPKITNLVCTFDDLTGEVTGTYEENDTYDNVTVLRDGVEIQTVNPGVGTFVDIPPGPAMYQYTVESNLGGDSCRGGGSCEINTIPPLNPPCPDTGDFLTHSTSQDIIPGNSVACVDPATFVTADNSYWRTFTPADFGVPESIQITHVEIGVEIAIPGPGFTSQPLTLRIYDDPDGGAPSPVATLVELLLEDFQVEPADEEILCLTLSTPVVIPAGTTVVVEIAIPDATPPPGSGEAHMFFIGSNPDPETDVSYLSSVACGLAEPTPVGAIGFPSFHILMNVYYETLGQPTLVLRGDFNNDGGVNFLVDALFGLNAGFVVGSPQPACLTQADANGDRSVNFLVDALYMLNAGFVVGSPLPSPPYPDCGEDDNGIDALGCETPSMVCNP